MKIIDGKGRLFGKINVIDFLAILFLLCLMRMFYFGYKLYVGNKKAEAELRGEALKHSLVDTQKSEPIEEKEFLSKKKTETANGLLSASQLNDIINRITTLEENVNKIIDKN